MWRGASRLQRKRARAERQRVITPSLGGIHMSQSKLNCSPRSGVSIPARVVAVGATVAAALAITAPATAGMTAPAAVTSCASGTWLAEYFNNMTLANNPRLSQCALAINYHWGYGAPAPGVPSDGFSVRWTRSSTFAEGSYVFSTTSDDGVRVLLDPGTSTARTVISNWTDHATTTNTATVAIPAGTHNVRVEYYERTGRSVAKARLALMTPPISGVPNRVPGYWWSDVESPTVLTPSTVGLSTSDHQ